MAVCEWLACIVRVIWGGAGGGGGGREKVREKRRTGQRGERELSLSPVLPFFSHFFSCYHPSPITPSVQASEW